MVELTPNGGPLHERTWDIDRDEGRTVNDLIAVSVTQLKLHQ